MQLTAESKTNRQAYAKADKSNEHVFPFYLHFFFVFFSIANFFFYKISSFHMVNQFDIFIKKIPFQQTFLPKEDGFYFFIELRSHISTEFFIHIIDNLFKGSIDFFL